jgi:uncharacterized protein YbaP (TraB family)
VVYLRETLAQFEENAKILAEMIACYEKGDDEAIGEIMVKAIRDFGRGEAERELGERLIKSLLTDRDKTMAEAIDAKLRKNPRQSHFFAVGSAHLLGKTSIRKHLADKGWRIARVGA